MPGCQVDPRIKRQGLVNKLLASLSLESMAAAAMAGESGAGSAMRGWVLWMTEWVFVVGVALF